MVNVANLMVNNLTMDCCAIFLSTRHCGSATGSTVRSDPADSKLADDLRSDIILKLCLPVLSTGAGGGIRTHESLRNRVIGIQPACFARSF